MNPVEVVARDYPQIIMALAILGLMFIARFGFRFMCWMHGEFINWFHCEVRKAVYHADAPEVCKRKHEQTDKKFLEAREMLYQLIKHLDLHEKEPKQNVEMYAYLLDGTSCYKDSFTANNWTTAKHQGVRVPFFDRRYDDKEIR